MKKKMLLLPLVVLFLAGLACNAGSGNTGPTSTPAPTPIPEPTEDPNILFTDDFSSSSSGWDIVRDEPDTPGMTDYDQGGYRIQVLEADFSYWANPGLSGLSDVSITVEAKKLSGPDDNAFGIICRYVDISNFYVFLASSDGYYGISKVVDGNQELIGEENLLPTDAIKQGADAVNTLRADCVGSTLTLFINGTQVTQFQDVTFASGDVGLLARTLDILGTDILFDNFVVRKP